jgi:hypothetical protein
MIYRLASRDNIDSERFESWPAVLNISFTKFNNCVEEPIFSSEDDVLNWLESRSRTKSINRHTNVQEFRNGDPNKLYSVYGCTHPNANHGCEMNDTFLYSLRHKKGNETFMTFTNEKGKRIKSSFKKIDQRMQNIEEVEYSADIREIQGEYYEGIYPIEPIDIKNDGSGDQIDMIEKRYLQFARGINEMDTLENKKKEYSVVMIDKPIKWIDCLVERLEHVERYLEFFARGGNTSISLPNDPERQDMIQHIFKMMAEYRKCTPEDTTLQLNVRNIVIDPLLCTTETFQVRHNKMLISWHRNYSYIIRKYNLIPSKQFSDMILNFSLFDFFKQLQNKENLSAMIKNLEDIYNVRYIKENIQDKNIILVKDRNKRYKINKIVKSFT